MVDPIAGACIRSRASIVHDRRGFAMTTLRWLSVILLFLASSLPAQTRTVAERLGYPRDAKLLILHADDLGFTHSANAASFDALDKGVISSAASCYRRPG